MADTAAASLSLECRRQQYSVIEEQEESDAVTNGAETVRQCVGSVTGPGGMSEKSDLNSNLTKNGRHAELDEKCVTAAGQVSCSPPLKNGTNKTGSEVGDTTRHSSSTPFHTPTSGTESIAGRCNLRKAYSFNSPSPRKGTESSSPKQVGGERQDELSAVFRRRSRGVDGGDAERLIKDYEQRLSEDRRRNSQSDGNIVDSKLSELLKSRRQRVDSAVEETKRETSSAERVIEFEQMIESTRRASLKVESDREVDGELSQVLKARQQRISVDCSSHGLSSEDRKLLRDRRHSGLSPQSTVTSPRSNDTSNVHVRETSGHAGVSYVGGGTSQPAAETKRRRISGGQSFDSSGASDEMDKNRRALRPTTRTSFRKEKTPDPSDSIADPQLAALMKLRKEAVARKDSLSDVMVSDHTSR